MTQVAVIIVAAGEGSRAGGEIPKQFQTLGGLRLVDWSARAALGASRVDRVVVVGPQGGAAGVWERWEGADRFGAVVGGATRTASVRAGLAALRESPPDVVLIHDAARPGLSEAIIDRLIDALADADAASPALPVADALKRQEEDRVAGVDRDRLFGVQTPQAFRYEVIAAAYANAEDSAVDDLALLPASARVKLIRGDHRLMKVTFPEDLAQLERMLLVGDVRTGSGFDVHAFCEGEFVTLCGVAVPHEFGLSGHSDADVGWHALTDAILGALALGDIGDHFPPSDDRWKGADSSVFLAHAVQLARESDYRISSADVTLICEAPRVGPHRDAMRSRTAEVLGVELDRVSVKATTTEKLGFTGRKEGIAAQAVVTLMGRRRDV